MKLMTPILLSVFAVAFTALQTEGRRLRSEAFGERTLRLVPNKKVSSGPFKGWWNAGLNKDANRVGILSDIVYVESKGSTKSSTHQFGGLMHKRAPGDFLGKPVELTAMIKTADVISGTVNLWFSVGGKKRDDRRPVKATINIPGNLRTSEWKKYTIALDVPEDSKQLAYGFMVAGEGKAWMKDFRLTEGERTLRLVQLDDNEERVPTGPFKDWWKNGLNKDTYRVGFWSEKFVYYDTVFVESKVTTETERFGGLMHTRRPGHFLGKRVKLTAKVKTADVLEGSGLWFRVDGVSGKELGFDNMYDRPITGTTGWKEYSIVLDVPEDAKYLAYGFMVGGEGKAWMKDFTLVEEQTLESDEMDDEEKNLMPRKLFRPRTVLRTRRMKKISGYCNYRVPDVHRCRNGICFMDSIIHSYSCFRSEKDAIKRYPWLQNVKHCGEILNERNGKYSCWPR